MSVTILLWIIWHQLVFVQVFLCYLRHAMSCIFRNCNFLYWFFYLAHCHLAALFPQQSVVTVMLGPRWNIWQVRFTWVHLKYSSVVKFLMGRRGKNRKTVLLLLLQFIQWQLTYPYNFEANADVNIIFSLKISDSKACNITGKVRITQARFNS